MKENSMYYNWRKIDGYGCPLKIVLSRRGLGKTFKVVQNKGIWRFLTKEKMFIYVVETKEMVKQLCMNKGEKFFCNIIDYCKDHPSNKNNIMYNALIGSELTEFEIEKKQQKDQPRAMTIGGAIKIQGKTAGYIVAYNDYGDLKRNNFLNPGTIVFDEFIPEKRDIRNLQDPYKMVSVVESVARLKDVEIIMLANTVRADDPVLIRMGLTNMKLGEFRKIYNKKGKLFGVCHLVDPAEYPEFAEKQDDSVSGNFAQLMGENKLNENTFKGAITEDLLLPEKLKQNHLMLCLHGEDISVRIHATQDYNEYYVLQDYGRNTKLRYCVDKKYISPCVRYSLEWGETLKELFQQNKLRFENNMVYFYFKSILKIS